MTARNLLPVLFLSCWQFAAGDYVVTQTLSNLAPGDTVTISGDTSASGGPVGNGADFHILVTDPDGNWGRERVYQFTLTEPAVLEVERVNQTGDPDYILLTNLITLALNDTRNFSPFGIAFTGLDDPAVTTESLRGYPPGTYYLSVESYDGATQLDGSINASDATFTTKLKASAATAYDLRQIVGVVGAEDQPLAFDTNDSAVDTVLALYRDNGDGTGELLATDDNSGLDGADSALDLPDGLPAGGYLLAVGGLGTTFADDFNFTAGTTGGNTTLHLSRGDYNDALEHTGSLSLNFPATSVDFYYFVIETAPAATDLGEIATTADDLSLSLVESDGLPEGIGDTELALYDAQGFIYERSDDFDFEGGVYHGQFDFAAGELPAGTWYLAVTGWDYRFYDGFLIDRVGLGSTAGDYQLNFQSSNHTNTLEAGEYDWYRFEVAEAPAAPLVISGTAFDPLTNEFQISWETKSGQTYAVYHSATLEGFTVLPGQTGLSGPTVTIPVTPANDSFGFFQIREE